MSKKTRGNSAIVTSEDKNGAPSMVTARRKLGLVPASASPIGTLAGKLFGGKSSFMEFARLAVHINPRLAVIVEDYESLPAHLRAAVSIDEICVKHDIDPIAFIGEVGEAAKKWGLNAGILVSALSFPDVVGKSVKQALTADGFKDREMLAKHEGFIPTPHGGSITVNANAAARADSTAAEQTKGLPSFERTMRDSDDVIRERE